MSLTEDIKEFGLDLGFSRVGITTADSFPGYITELKSRRDMYDWMLEGRFQINNADPKETMPSAKSIVVAVYDAFKESFPEKLIGKIGRIYQARCYSTPHTRINGARNQLMRNFLESKGIEVAARLFIPERLSAARAGVTTFGKNNFAIAEGIGSFIIISTFVIDSELEYDQPTVEEKCPPKCTACIDNCPTGALYEPMKMNPRRCVAFYTFGPRYIPPEIRDNMGIWIHGCDMCQEKCPRNQKKLKAKLPHNDFLVKVAQDFELTKLLNLSEEFYIKRVQPLMYNYIREKKYFQRNAAIALGNLGDNVFIPDLKQAMDDPEPVVRGYSAWALGKIGTKNARRILEKSLAREIDESAKQEITAALEIA